MTNRNPCSYLSSADNRKSIQVAGHYSAHIGIAPSSKLTRFLRKYHYQKYVSLPRATAAHFARHSPLLTFASMKQKNELTSTYKDCEKEVRELKQKQANLNQYLGKNMPTTQDIKNRQQSL